MFYGQRTVLNQILSTSLKNQPQYRKIYAKKKKMNYAIFFLLQKEAVRVARYVKRCKGSLPDILSCLIQIRNQARNVCVCVCVLVTQSIISDSLQPHGLQPTRFLCPQDSPGKNTGVSILLQRIFQPRSRIADRFFTI